MQQAAGKKRLIGIVLAIFLVAVVAATVATTGIGAPSLPAGDIAFVRDAPNGDITSEELEAEIVVSAYQSGVEVEGLEEGSPEQLQLRDAAMGSLIQRRWLHGEAEELNIRPSDREVAERLEEVKAQSFPDDQWEQFLEDSPYTEETATEVIALGLLTEKIQEASVPTTPPAISDRQIELFYENNIDQFRNPESRDVRILTTAKEGKARKAYELLEEDSSVEGWTEAIEKFADAPPPDPGGLNPNMTPGTNLPELDTQIFESEIGTLIGPVDVSGTWYVAQPEALNEASTTPLDEATDQIRTQLEQNAQNRLATAFSNDFVNKWRARTICADDYVMQLCSNAPAPPDSCPIDDPSDRETITAEQLALGCDAPVRSRAVVLPGATYVPAGGQADGALNQNPQHPAQPEPELDPEGRPILPPGHSVDDGHNH